MHGRLQAYQPPDLFLPGRPAIRWAPAFGDYGSVFQVGADTPDVLTCRCHGHQLIGGCGRPRAMQVELNTSAAAVTRVVLMEPGSVTHSASINQRAQQLAFEVTGASELTVTCPASPVLAPAGFYLLWVLAGNAYSRRAGLQQGACHCGCTAQMAGYQGAVTCLAARRQRSKSQASLLLCCQFSGHWIQMRRGNPFPPFTIPQTAEFVAEASW